jgi:RND superfamily putative drug exporter
MGQRLRRPSHDLGQLVSRLTRLGGRLARLTPPSRIDRPTDLARWGRVAARHLLGFTCVGAVASMIPSLLFSRGIGLSMDYELFLISRVAELHHEGESNDRSVEHGRRRSGRIITSAALLVVIVFSGFIAGRMLIIKEMGFALSLAVLLDATVVRMLLVPATMTLLGDYTWWAPARMHRWWQRYGLRG